MGLNNLKYFILLTFFIITSCDSEIKEDVINKEKLFITGFPKLDPLFSNT